MATKKKADSYTSYAKYGKKMQSGGKLKERVYNPEMEIQRKRMAERAKPSKIAIKPKMQKGGKTSFGMLSVKAGVDKNPNPTAADRIAGAKMRSGKMRSGGTVGKSLGTYGRQLGKNYSGKGGKMKTCKYGC